MRKNPPTGAALRTDAQRDSTLLTQVEVDADFDDALVRAKRALRYEVSIHGHGRKLIRRGPAEGLLEWPVHTWGKITPRPLGLKSATALADAQPGHAVVNVWMDAEVAYDNGKTPTVPDGWWPAEAFTAHDARSGAGR